MDLRNYFLGASEAPEVSFDLSGLELGGVKPFCAPVKAQGWLKGSPTSVELSGTVCYTMTMPCDRMPPPVRSTICGMKRWAGM